MPLGDLVRFVREALGSHRARAFLTVVGIVIGIASAVLLSSVGEGTRRSIASQFTQFGTTVITIKPGKSETFGGAPGYLGGTTHKLTLEDVRALARVAGVRFITPCVAGVGKMEYGDRSRDVYLFGGTDQADDVWQWRPRVGSFLPEGEGVGSPAVCVLGAKPAEELFGAETPLGKHVRVGAARFQVIGVMEAKGEVLGYDVDNSVYIPVDRAQRLFRRDELSEIHVTVASHEGMDATVNEMMRVLKERHEGEEDFTMVSQAEMLRVIEKVLRVLTAGVVAIAGIAIFVGAMGILTVQWVAVHDRQKEVGLLKAVGASNRQVLLVFLAESAALSVLGGLVGIAAGMGGGALLGALVPGLSVETPVEIIPIALGVSLAVGLAAGVVPALRAARLDPVEALRAD